MKETLILLLLISPFYLAGQNTIVSRDVKQSFSLEHCRIVYAPEEEELVSVAAQWLANDIEAVTGIRPSAGQEIPENAGTLILIATIQSSILPSLLPSSQINSLFTASNWEAFQIKTLEKPVRGIHHAILIIGSDRRGAAYGVAEFSAAIGVSPWYWWADVPVKKNPALRIAMNYTQQDHPRVKYRGIFINDEAPALSNWTREKFGGFNHLFYEKVFELILRLKGNYLWPAMWGNAFYDDDSLNIRSAEKYGIVIGTSHHEPLMRAHDEWRRYGQGKWNYDSNEVQLKEFWRLGMKRATNEKIVSVGMRGDGDMPMSMETATSLLERIVKDQRDIIREVTGKPASETPQLWALYKEVQDYYDKGMRVPDDVTLLLCDDNWGNLRKLPTLNSPPRKGGYGIYYHFDYVGGPRNYKWVNTNTLPKIWEQMHLAWEYGVKNIWIVNVGDIKPMELPISFWLAYAWNPEKINQNQIQPFIEKWATAQFGAKQAKEIADIMARYSKYNSRRKPELLDANTYSFNYEEWPRVAEEYNKLRTRAENLAKELPAEYQDAYFQLVLHPVKACANLYEMYYYHALNKKAYAEKLPLTNHYAQKVKELFDKDSLISLEYHQLANGKWNHMMSQTHIGYSSWQQPPYQKMPPVNYLPADSAIAPVAEAPKPKFKLATTPAGLKGNVFVEDERSGVSIEAIHYTRKVETGGIKWVTLPDLGRTGSSITSFPVTIPASNPVKGSPCLEYDIYTLRADSVTLYAYFSPVLNFHNNPEGTRYAVSIDHEIPQVISLNKEDKTSSRGIWNKWVGENIIIKSSRHKLLKPGKHTIRIWRVDPGAVLQKLVLDTGNLKPSYLGPPETKIVP